MSGPLVVPALLEGLLAGHDLDEAAAADVMAALMSGEVDPLATAAILIALRSKGETAAEVAGFVRGMLAAATRLPLDAATAARAVDTCGTGGDGAGTINVSTIAALVVAAAGIPVAKHGNRAASSLAGSADLLEAWGVAIELGPAAAASVLTDVGVTFLFARRFHPAMRHVAPVRSALGVRTIFNVLGPLCNPAGVTRQVIGVPSAALGELVAGALARFEGRRALIVHGDDGLDELTTTTSSRVWEVRDGTVRQWSVDPRELDIATVPAAALRGGDVARNVALADAVLEGREPALRDLVALNAAAALVVADEVEDLAAGVVLARELLATGAARDVRDRWVERSQLAAQQEAEASV